MEKNRKILEAIKNHSLESKTISFATVSGIVTTNPGMIRRIDALPDFTLITTKSYQVNPNPGNREPVIVEPENGSFGNAVGLRNPGMIKGLEELKKLTSRETLTSILNISVSGNSVEEFITLIRHFEGIADIIELNLSCPHAAKGYGMAIGTDPEVVYSYLSELRKVTDALIFPKLTPNVDSISEIAIAAVQGGADGITAINTAGPRLYVEPVSGEPLLLNNSGNKGGMSGKWIKDLAVKKVSEIREALGPD
ncbi:MAG: dihydroorotate dehydrogenase, partial [Spirochaetes bacterium]